MIPLSFSVLCKKGKNQNISSYVLYTWASIWHTAFKTNWMNDYSLNGRKLAISQVQTETLYFIDRVYVACTKLVIFRWSMKRTQLDFDILLSFWLILRDIFRVYRRNRIFIKKIANIGKRLTRLYLIKMQDSKTRYSNHYIFIFLYVESIVKWFDHNFICNI